MKIYGGGAASKRRAASSIALGSGLASSATRWQLHIITLSHPCMCRRRCIYCPLRSFLSSMTCFFDVLSEKCADIHIRPRYCSVIQHQQQQQQQFGKTQWISQDQRQRKPDSTSSCSEAYSICAWLVTHLASPSCLVLPAVNKPCVAVNTTKGAAVCCMIKSRHHQFSWDAIIQQVGEILMLPTSIHL